MSIESAQAATSDALKKLMANWARTRESWRDSTAQDYEKQHILPLELEVRKGLSAMNSMNEILHQARRDCDPDKTE